MNGLLYGVFQFILAFALLALAWVFFALAGILAHRLDRTRAWMRWVFVLPGALLFAFLIMFPLHWIIQFWIYQEWFSAQVANTIESYAYRFIVPFAFILAVGRIAPKAKVRVAGILTIVVPISMAYSIYQFLGRERLDVEAPVKFYASCALVVLGLVCGVYATAKGFSGSTDSGV